MPSSSLDGSGCSKRSSIASPATLYYLTSACSIGFWMERYPGYVENPDSPRVPHELTVLRVQTEVLNSPPITLLPKNILKAPSHNPTDQEASPAYQALPNPSPTHPLRNPDQRFLDSEVFTNKFAAHIGGSMEKVSRRTIKRWSGAFPLYFRVRRGILTHEG